MSQYYHFINEGRKLRELTRGENDQLASTWGSCENWAQKEFHSCGSLKWSSFSFSQTIAHHYDRRIVSSNMILVFSIWEKKLCIPEFPKTFRPSGLNVCWHHKEQNLKHNRNYSLCKTNARGRNHRAILPSFSAIITRLCMLIACSFRLVLLVIMWQLSTKRQTFQSQR